MKWYGDRAIKAVDQAAVEALERAARELLAEATRLVPVDEGELRHSGRVVVTDEGSLVVYDAPHAIPVHERLDVHHAVGQAKYLEEPTQRFGGELMAILADALVEVLT